MKSFAGRELMEKLGHGEDLDAVLKAAGVTLGTAVHVVRCRSVRREMRWRRKMLRLQGRLLAERALPAAMQGLCALLANDAPAVRLKSVLTVLAVTGLDRAPERVRKEAEKAVEAEPTAEQKEFMAAVSRVMAEDRWKQVMAGGK